MKTLLIVGASALAVWITAHPVAAQTEKGAQVYAAQKCSSCHSIADKGNKKGPLDDVGSKLTSDQIREWIVDPAGMTAKQKAARKPPMPAKYASLPKDDLDALVTYLASLKK
jgi:mono/diheme cytochrome c family protein